VKFVYPIAGKDADELYKLNMSGTGGYFPIGMCNSWHGGIHLEGKNTLVAIADGDIIAYRFSKEYNEFTRNEKAYKYSNCFVLLKHQYETPNGAKLKFYSLYAACAGYNSYTEEQKKNAPVFKQKKGYKILTKGLSVRSSGEVKDDNLIRKFTGGEEVLATAVDDSWAKIDDKEEYFAFSYNGTKHAKEALIDQAPEYDKVVTCKISVKAGDIVGYSGIYEHPLVGAGHTMTHIEVFSSDDVPSFIKNPGKDGARKPTALQVQAGAVLKVKEKRYSDSELKVGANLSIGALGELKVLDDTDPEYLKVKEYAMQRHVHRKNDLGAPLGKGDIIFKGKKRNVTRYHLKKERYKDLAPKFDSYDFDDEQVVYYYKYADEKGNVVSYSKEDTPDYRYVILRVDDEMAEEYWVKRTAFESVEGDYAFASKKIQDLKRYNPNEIKFEKDAGTIAEETFIPIDKCETCKGGNGETWYKVTAGAVTGWIQENDSKLTKQSAFDWQGFKVIKEDGDTAYDMLIDYNKVTPFFKKIFKEVDTSGDGKISKEEMQKALKDEKLSKRLSKCICYHPSAWSVDTGFGNWQKAFLCSDEEQKKNLQAMLKELCSWWSVLGTSFASPNVYHFHPVAFVEQMREMNINEKLTEGILKKIAKYATSANILKHLNGINQSLEQFEIDTTLKRCHFLAQLITESGSFRYTKEQRVADTEYGGFVGRGLIQLTWEDNYKAYGNYVNENFTSSMSNKQKLENDPHAAKSAGWFWAVKAKLNDDAQNNDFIYIVKTINGGYNGYNHRLSALKNALTVLDQTKSFSTSYNFSESKAYNDMKAAFGWGAWHDPDSSKSGCTKSKKKAKEGYQRFIDLHNEKGKPSLSRSWYGYNKSTIRSFAEERIAVL